MEHEPPVAAPRQLTMIWDSVALKGLAPAERRRVVALIARLLLEVGGTVKEGDDDEEL